ncbi:SAM-dependent methyltransferase [Candidatus Kaiserbacteria bacterium RIFCSPHIGHO2_01_FULL_46_22]|uniref:SAM-dependent methyltransferase n=1 Tax=Candidatus Kaiserbacteria bacterium RIFCSPHIGHO2_01_FULL_46_22 TaxID=1798475 RepID=A0A1F6BXG7_9BACT|nr:MAG: SAM-dependent methyltransferase [Candidatus Kaiserbacteria bacterium RIFCSPHIGHO2_01_FULL_46_22]
MNNLCRFCQNPLKHTFVDLGMSPVSNDYIDPTKADEMEPFYPLRTYVCEQCLLVQLPSYQKREEIFTNQYAYFSSFSTSWLQHAKEYANMMMKRLGLGSDSLVVELASNDGYLLQYFKEQNVPVLGVEPCQNVAEAAEKIGIPTLVKFFGVETAKEMLMNGNGADLLLGNNVLAHVPDLNDFVAGMKILLKESGVITIEFPHLMSLMKHNQFDTIYHEHFSYFSLLAVEKVFARHGFTIFDVEQLSTHGGSLRIFARHTENNSLPVTARVQDLHEREKQFGLHDLATYSSWASQVYELKRTFLQWICEEKNSGKIIVGYGAPAKGNTFLNYCGVRSDLIDYTVDKSPHKQNHLLPGTRIPIYDPEKIRKTKPDYVLILPWNLQDEIAQQMDYIREWGGKFVVAIPEIKVF